MRQYLDLMQHVLDHGTKKEDLAAVSVANYNYASDNPKAQMQRKLTMEEAMSAPVLRSRASLTGMRFHNPCSMCSEKREARPRASLGDNTPSRRWR